jgi:hypothetical protein
MKSLNKFLLCLFLCLTACQEDEPSPVVVPDPEITLLTFKQDENSTTAFSDDWIFITNENGDLLDIKHFEANETIILKSDKVTEADKINVTIFHYLQPNTETIDFTSYLGITSNQSWIYNKIEGISPIKTGTAKFNIANIPTPPSPTITVSTNLARSSTRPTSPASVDFGLYASQEKIFACVNLEDTPAFFEAIEVENGAIIEANYATDFNPLPNIFTLDLGEHDGYAGSVDGIMNEPGVDPYYLQGFLNYSRIGSTLGAGNLVKWGYKNGFDLYRIWIRKGLGKVSRHYFKLGDPVTTIPFPDHTFSPVTTAVNGFSFSISADYHLRNSRWTVPVPDYQSVLSWRVFSPPGGKQVFPEIPDEISLLYPSLSLSSLVLKDNTFTIYLDDFSYSDFINGKMNINSSKKPYSSEYQTVIVQH